MERLLLSTIPNRAFVIFVIHLLVICTNTPLADGAHILGLFATPAPSHHMMFQALMKALVEHGHSVEVASPCPLRTPAPDNYTDIALPIPEMDRAEVLKMLIRPDHSPVMESLGLWSVSKELCEIQLSSPELQNYLSKDPKSFKFDLVIVEVFYFDCMLGFAHRFDVPIIGMISQSMLPWAYDIVGNPLSYSHVPNLMLPLSSKMNFWERLYNSLYTVGGSLFRRFVAFPQQNEVAKRYFGPEMPPLWEIEKNISLILSNGHPAFSPIHSYVPNLVDVGGMHIMKSPPPLQKDLQHIMDSDEKVILFSLGTIIESSTIAVDRLEVVLAALKELKCKVIWKWDGDVNKLPVPLPSNVHVYKWIPQQSLLAHPNLVGFVTHGGLLSLQEATYHGVPLVGFPFYGDQSMNLRHASEAGMCISLRFYEFKTEDLINAVHEILYNPSYLKIARRLSSIFRDQPETPLQRGVYWTEYILRHKGGHHLKSAATNLNWIQYNLADVAAFIFIVLLALVITFVYSCKLIKSIFLLYSRKSKKE